MANDELRVRICIACNGQFSDEPCEPSECDILRIVENLDPESLRPKGRWELEARSFYRDTFDESCELVVYIVANCSCCGGKHPNYHQVYSKNLYPPDEDDRDYQFDQDEERAKVIAEYKELFQSGRRKLANYCPNCGAKMEG